MPLEAIVFDYGQVLSFREKAEHLRRIASSCALDYGRFLSVYDSHMPGYDGGDFDGQVFWRRVLAELEIEPTPERIAYFIDEDTASTLMLNPAMLGWAEALRRAGYGTAILSNMSPDDLARMKREGIFDRLDGFGVRIFSTEVRTVKPDPAIFRLCLDALALPADATLFIDDKEANIRAAQAAGMRAHLFTDWREAVPEICRRYSLPRPSYPPRATT